jgi:hypothetical protein
MTAAPCSTVVHGEGPRQSPGVGHIRYRVRRIAGRLTVYEMAACLAPGILRGMDGPSAPSGQMARLAVQWRRF